MRFSFYQIFFAAVVISILSTVAWYKSYRNLKADNIVMNENDFQQGYLNSNPTVQSLTPDKELNENDILTSKRKAWTEFQHELRDTVVQVFAGITEFNWLEPYKTPNQSEVTGTAFFISSKGELITNAHVVDQARVVYIQIPSSGKHRYLVDIVGISPERDLALLKLRDSEIENVKRELKVKDIRYLSLGDSDLIGRSDKIMALGYPLGQQGLKSTTGVVSGREHINGQYFIQISAPLNKGNSGGPSLDSKGNVIGVNSAIIQNAQNVGYIVPINEVKLFLNQLQTMPETGGPKLLRKPFLGVLFNNANENLTAFLGNPAPGGLYIVDVYKGSPLHKAGLKPGDMIYKINDIDVDVYGEMKVPWSKEEKVSIIDYVSRLKIGQKIQVEYYRKGTKKSASFIFTQSERPPIRRMYPGYEKIDYEVIAGLVIMPMTINHIFLLAQFAPELVMYADLKKHMEPALIITHVFLNSPAAWTRTIGPGAVISEVNGEKVKTLEQFRAVLKKTLSTKYLTIKTTENIFVAIPLKEIIENENQLSSIYFYPISETFKIFEKEYLKNTK